MALIKTIQDDTGVGMEYHRVNSIEIHKTGAVFWLWSYVSQSTREAGNEPLAKKAYNSLDDNPFTVEALEADSPYKLAYSWLKTTEEFEGATDA